MFELVGLLELDLTGVSGYLIALLFPLVYLSHFVGSSFLQRSNTQLVEASYVVWSSLLYLLPFLVLIGFWFAICAGLLHAAIQHGETHARKKVPAKYQHCIPGLIQFAYNIGLYVLVLVVLIM